MVFQTSFCSWTFWTYFVTLKSLNLRLGPLPSELAPEISETPKDAVAVTVPADEVEDNSSRKFVDIVWKFGTLTGCMVVRCIHCIWMVKMKDTANRKMASFACLQSSPFGAIWDLEENFCSKVLCQALVFAASALFLLTGFKLTRLVSDKTPSMLAGRVLVTKWSKWWFSRGITQEKSPWFRFMNYINLPRFWPFPATLFYISQSRKLFSNCSMEVFGKTPDA